MDNLAQILASKRDQLSLTPIFFDFNEEADRQKVSELVSAGKIQLVIDDFEEEHLELFGVKNPSKVYTPTFKQEFQTYYQNLQSEKPLWQHGLWVLYPWSCKLVHILSEPDFFLVRTARNKNLINAEEQEKYYNAKIGIGGLSVGSSVAFALALPVIPKKNPKDLFHHQSLDLY
jgi:hypothetical protein